MPAVVCLVTADELFAQSLERTLAQWGMRVQRQESNPLVALKTGGAGLVLLDIRQRLEEALLLLNGIRSELPEVEVIIINRPDNMRASLAGMQAGAAEEIITPCDTGLLRKILTEAWERQQRAGRRKRHPSPGVPRETMAADFMPGKEAAQKPGRSGGRQEHE